MGIISVIAGSQLRSRLYEEGAALPYRGMSVLDDVPWGDGLHFMTIITDQTPAGNAGRGHYDAFEEGGRIKFKKERDV